MSRSLRSTERGPRIPPNIPTGEITGLKLAHVDSFVRPGTLLGRVSWLLWRFVATLGRFWCVLARSGLDFGGFRVAPGRVLELDKKRRKIQQKSILRGSWAVFGKGLGPSWAFFGCFWPSLGRFLSVQNRASFNHWLKMGSKRASG